MTWIALSLKDWQRRPLRNSVTAAGVAIAVAALFSLVSFERGYQEGMQHELDRLGAQVLVVPKGCPYDAASIALHGASWPCYLKAAYLEEVRATRGVAAAAPVFMAAFTEPAGAQAVYVGVEKDILALKSAWRITGRFPEKRTELLVGDAAAQREHWQIGESVSLPGLSSQRGVVAGILQPTRGADDEFIFLRLKDAQRWFNRERELTHILVRLADPNQLEEVVARLRGCDAGLDMNVVPLAHLFRSIRTLVNATRLLLGCVALAALFVAGAGVSNAILMAVSERTREIGVMRALGASHADVFRLFWLETVQVCLAGGIAGVVAASAASRGVEMWLRARLPFAPTEALIRWEWWVAAVCVLGALLLGSAAGLLPAWRAARLEPIEAMRTEGPSA